MPAPNNLQKIGTARAWLRKPQLVSLIESNIYNVKSLGMINDSLGLAINIIFGMNFPKLLGVSKSFERRPFSIESHFQDFVVLNDEREMMKIPPLRMRVRIVLGPSKRQALLYDSLAHENSLSMSRALSSL